MAERQRYIPEREFTENVIKAADQHGWRTFHLRDRDSIHIVRGRGFPDLVMFRKDPETGQVDLIAAELKRSSESVPTPEQVEWLNALGQHIPARTWRPKDWDEIEDVLKNGAGEQRGSGQLTVRQPVGTISRNFGPSIMNIIEAIEDKEMTTGDKASLRRMDPTNPATAAFWKLASQQGISRNAEIKKWGLITHGIALIAHTAVKAHHPRRPVGRTLYEGGGEGGSSPFYSENRLATLLAARGPTLHRLLARLFRMLASKGCAFNWREMAWFILNEGCNEEEADKSRIEIARAYYQAMPSEHRNRNPNTGGS